MKKMTMLRSIAAVALFTVVGMSLSAQVITSLPTAKSITAPSDTSSAADTVSLGAQMPYFVHPDAVIKKATALYNPSGFKWTITGTGATLNTGSLTPTSIGGSGTYYTDSMVIATFASVGTASISTVERSSPKFAPTGGCEQATPRTIGVEVISLPVKPTIADADTAQGGCTGSPTYTINFNFSSSSAKFPIYVSYTVRAYDVNNSLLATSTTQYYRIANASSHMTLDKATDIDAVTSASGVRYTVTLGQMWDRISSNATNRNSLAVDASSVKAAIFVLPTPSTGIIKHIKTL